MDSALGLGAPNRPWFHQRMADLDRYLSNMPPPPWPFNETHPINQQFAAEGHKPFTCAIALRAMSRGGTDEQGHSARGNQN